ncbi:MAG: NADH-quinone oxidoreductase subunit C, partial [Mangrovicoccus sp.]|nr:NADH-quinone oxidoreductase subunit C [Mangrovicoccus sp.]
MSDDLEELAAHLEIARPDCVISTQIAFGELTASVALGSLLGFCEFLKIDPTCQFSTLIDITAVDHPSREKRFDLIYHFLSMYQNHRIRIRVELREDDIVPSLTGVYPAANWFEREAYDMFGVLFSGHPDLR